MDYAVKVVELLKEKNLTITTAESCTGGLIAKMITDVSGASGVFGCGIISYANEIKMSLLNVRKETLEKYGAVSEQTVREMADGAAAISGADIAVAVSGIAGPLSDETSKPVGLIYIAVKYNGKCTIKKLCNSFSENIRENNRLSAAQEALGTVYSILTAN